MTTTEPEAHQPRKPTSLKQILANQSNGRLGGPKTAAGKAIVAQNAVKHGGYAQPRAIRRGLFEEDQDDLDALIDAVLDDLRPRGAIEELAAREVGAAYIGLLRYRALEAFRIEVLTGEGLPINEETVRTLIEQATIYEKASAILTWPVVLETAADWDIVLAAFAITNDGLRALHATIDPTDPAAFDPHHEIIRTAITSLGGEHKAAEVFAKHAKAKRDEIPSPERLTRLAEKGLANPHRREYVQADLSGKTIARLTNALDRSFRHYMHVRASTDLLNSAGETEAS